MVFIEDVIEHAKHDHEVLPGQLADWIDVVVPLKRCGKSPEMFYGVVHAASGFILGHVDPFASEADSHNPPQKRVEGDG